MSTYLYGAFDCMLLCHVHVYRGFLSHCCHLYFLPFSSVFIVDFEQVNILWAFS